MSKNCAIAIGINQYYNLRPLKYAQQDAEAIRNFCQNELTFETVYFFSEDASPIQPPQGPPLRSEPTLGNLERFLRVRFEEKFLEAGDNLWFFFAGHGKRYKGRDYLIPIDGDLSNVERTAISIRDISDRLRRSGADNIILIVDACRGEDDREGSEGIGREKQQGVVTLFSCSPNELSYEIDQLQQGTFTYALLEGLRLQGEGNCATVERLDQYLRHSVPQLNHKYRKPEQTPYSMVEPAAKYHLILLPRAATVKDAETLKLEAYRAEIKRDYELANQFWVRVLAVSPADPDAIQAIRRLAVRYEQQSRVSGTSSQRSNRVGAKTIFPIAWPEMSRRQALQILLAGAGGVGTWGLSKILPIMMTNSWLKQPQTSASSVPNPTSTLPVTESFRNLQRVEYKVVTVDEKGEIVKEENRQSNLFKAELGNEIDLQMLPIPSGSFQMGSPLAEMQRYENESPQHSVTVPGFWMGRYAVTQAQWKVVASWPMVQTDLNEDPSKFKGANRPVESISWDEAVEFCARMSKRLRREYRLPSEAEWEYACRGGSKTPFHFGEAITTEIANYDGSFDYGKVSKESYRQETTEVGRFKVANAYGLYDMHGNVWEWCQDHWHESYKESPIDGSAWVAGGDELKRILRGGSWYYFPRGCRSAYRYWDDQDVRYNGIGLRIVLVPTGT
jgi:formylglycine-generating enzyme required for sulfatase activity/uncharacterized caspase-like protein